MSQLGGMGGSSVEERCGGSEIRQRRGRVVVVNDGVVEHM